MHLDLRRKADKNSLQLAQFRRASRCLTAARSAVSSNPEHTKNSQYLIS